MKDAGTLRPEHVSLGKMGNVRGALEVCRSRAHDPRRERRHARVPRHPAHEQPRVRPHVRGHARGAHARRRPGAHRRERLPQRYDSAARTTGDASVGVEARRRAGSRGGSGRRGSARAPGSRSVSSRCGPQRCRSRRRRASGPMTSPMPFVVVASPEIAPRSPAGISLKRSPQARVITAPPAIATTKTTARYQACHVVAEAAAEQPEAVDDRRDRRSRARGRNGRRSGRRRALRRCSRRRRRASTCVDVESGSPSPTVK